MRTRNSQTVTVYKNGLKNENEGSSYQRWWNETATDRGVTATTNGYESWSSSYSRSEFKGGYSWSETRSGTNTESVTKGGVTTSKQTNWSWTRSGTVWDDGRNNWSETWSKSNWENGRSVPGESETARGSYDPKGTGTQTNNLPSSGEAPRLTKPPKDILELNKQPKYKPQPSKEFYELPLPTPPRVIENPPYNQVAGPAAPGGNPDVSKMSFIQKLKAAIQLVPGLLVGDAKAAFERLLNDPEFIGGLLALGIAFAPLQAIPGVAQAIDAALIIAFGFSAGFNLGSFLLNVFKAQDKQGLQAAANNFKNFLEAVGVLTLTGAIKLAGRVLRAIKEGREARTVWTVIKATQPVYERTLIPQSFELTANGQKFWVSPNATQHLAERLLGYIRSKGSDQGAELFTQFLLEDFRQAVVQAVQQKITYGQIMRIGRWELIFGPPRQAGQLPVIYHAVGLP